MAQYLLDTNHTSPLVTIGHPLRTKILAQREQGDIFDLCVPVITETKFGIGILPRAKSNLAEWQRLRPLLTTYALDASDAELAVDLQFALRKTGWQLGSFDALIAAVALRYDLTLLTTDRDFQAVESLQVENWLVNL
ncbi:MAG: type II toxin-antitoxin system VapC family toxin [Caldilineaceae bacterium]